MSTLSRCSTLLSKASSTWMRSQNIIAAAASSSSNFISSQSHIPTLSYYHTTPRNLHATKAEKSKAANKDIAKTHKVTMPALIEEVKQQMELPKGLDGMNPSDQSKLIDSVFKATNEVVVKNLEKGHHVSLFGLGVLKMMHVEAREYRNPTTGGPVFKEARDVVKFGKSKKLKELGLPTPAKKEEESHDETSK